VVQLWTDGAEREVGVDRPVDEPSRVDSGVRPPTSPMVRITVLLALASDRRGPSYAAQRRRALAGAWLATPPRTAHSLPAGWDSVLSASAPEGPSKEPIFRGRRTSTESSSGIDAARRVKGQCRGEAG
jgi:hypothetical protein